MKKVVSKLNSLVVRIQVIQEQLDELKSELENQQHELANHAELSSREQRKYDSLVEDIEYIDDVYYALDSAISEIENYID